MIANKARTLVLLSAVSGLALAAGGAFAQDTQPAAQTTAAAPADQEPVIVVSGQRRALQTAEQRKKNTDQIVDSITAVDIGALPDRSITEALQRIAGVTIGRTNEPRDIDRLNVEGSGVMIRGLTWVRSEINGRDSFGAKNGRSIGWEEVTPELAAGVDVYKNPSAEIVEGGLGGTVNLRTWMPFDSKSDKVAFSADATYGDLRKEWTPSASVLLSKRFDTKIGEMGLLLDVAHSELKSRLNALEVDPYDAHSSSTETSYDGGQTITTYNNAIAGQADGTTVMVPVGVEYRLEDRDKTRDGLYGAFQWKPTENSEFYATYFKTKSRLISQDHFLQTSACCSATNNQNFMNQPATGTDFTFDDEGNFVSGYILDGGGGGDPVSNAMMFNLGTRYGIDDSQTGDFSTGFKWHTDRWAFNLDFQHIDSLRTNYDMTVYNYFTAVGGVGLDVSGDLPKITLPDTSDSASSTVLYAAMDHQEIDKARQNTVKFDASYDFDSGFFKSFKFGYRATQRSATVMDSGYNWGAIGAPWLFAGQTANAADYSENQQVVNFSNFFGGDASVPSLWMPTMNLAKSTSATTDYITKLMFTPNTVKNAALENTFAYYCDTCGHGTIPSWASYGGQYNPFPAGSLASYMYIWYGATPNGATPSAGNFWSAFNGNYDYAPTSTSGIGTNLQGEKTQALYGMLRFGQDDLFGATIPWDGNFGIRVVRTDTTSSGRGTIVAMTGATNPSTMSAAAELATQFANGASTRTKDSNHYTNVLPSLNLRFKPTDSQFIRFAVASSIVRPDFNQLQPSFTVYGTYQSRNAVEADGVVDQTSGEAYTQAQLDALAASGAPVLYNTGASFSFSTGNPNLKPMKAMSYDLAYEWYIKPGSMLSVGLFDKELYDYIQSDSVSIQLTNNGVSETVVGNMPQNHGHGQIRGIEFQNTFFYDMLPGWLSGFGTDVNFTILETHGTQNTSGSVYDSVQVSSSKLDLPLEQLSRYSYNATIMYAKYGIDARLAYNWRSRYLMAASASNVQAPAYMEDYGQLDGSVMYNLNKNYKIGIQAVNILGAKNIIDIDERDNWYYGTQGMTSDSLIYRHNWTQADKRVSIVLRGSF
ncbi:MAG: TonB-dependent receptor [Asticcacaulis sp.]|uniref:TonB-dependent receptor n=1 Tax=Asticcacaulis sp. TaxID=1872648 RepID=UPI0039E40C6B